LRHVLEKKRGPGPEFVEQGQGGVVCLAVIKRVFRLGKLIHIKLIISLDQPFVRQATADLNRGNDALVGTLLTGGGGLFLHGVAVADPGLDLEAGREFQDRPAHEIMIEVIVLAILGVDEAIAQIIQKDGIAGQGDFHTQAGPEKMEKVGDFIAVALINIGAIEGVIADKRDDPHNSDAQAAPARRDHLQGGAVRGQWAGQGTYFQGGPGQDVLLGYQLPGK
jgi:hypothetical protein